MSHRVDLLIVTPHTSHIHHVPAGMVYVDQVLATTAAPTRRPDPASQPPPEEEWLAVCLQALDRRFGRRVRVHLVDPMTLGGLATIVRYRIRRFPTVIAPDGKSYAQPSVEALFQLINETLEKETS